MGMKSSRTLAAAVAAGALIAIPATASAAPSVSAEVVKKHTVKADRALDRALAQFARGADRAGVKSFRQSRSYLGKAKFASTKLTRTARTARARTEAATAWRVLAMQRDENLTLLVKLLEKVDAKTDKIVAKALLADTKHRDIAIGVIQDLINAGVVPKAEAGLNRVIAALSTGRAAEIGAQVGLLAEVKLPVAAQQSIGLAIQANLSSQARVAAVLDELIPQLEEHARAELEKALELVNSQLAAAAEMMDEVADLLPPFIRPLIQGVLQDIKALVEAITAPVTSGDVGTPPATDPPTTPVPGVPTIPGVEIPQVPLPFPVPMPSFVLDIINSILPGGLPMETTGFSLPFIDDILAGIFGEGGFLGGFFGGGSPGGFFGGGSSGGSLLG